jgi:RHS repeat-associated protein
MMDAMARSTACPSMPPTSIHGTSRHRRQCSLHTPKAAGSRSLVHRYYDPASGQFAAVDPQVGLTHSSYSYASGDPINDSDASGLCSTPTGNADKPFAYTPGACTSGQAREIDEAAALSRAQGAATGCSNALTCALQDPGSIVASFNSNRGTILKAEGAVLAVAAAGTGIGALAEGAAGLGAVSGGLGVLSGLTDLPDCIGSSGNHDWAACAGTAAGLAAGGLSFAGSIVDAANSAFETGGIGVSAWRLIAGGLVDSAGFAIGVGGLAWDFVNWAERSCEV